ncbi:MAG TPA: phospholipase D-like domain-containing protein [Thermoanaerobaculia bacterium]|jgi:phosphatidylserine/phosphatidylglycerophosphate/cardiolipin synthase-like enzyme
MNEFQVSGANSAALFTLKLNRGDGMCLLAMNWKKGKPPKEFVGFAIEYKEPGGDRFFALKNRLAFPGAGGEVDDAKQSTLLSPIQMFRWVHFPRNAELAGAFTYKVTPAFMNDKDELSYGEPQTAKIELRRETHPGKLNVAFTRGFVSSQAFVDKYVAEGQKPQDAVKTLLPAKADDGLGFIATHPKAKEALDWMGFEARSAILEVLDEAIADKTAEVRAVVYDLNEPGVVSRFEKLGKRLRIIIDDDGAHGKKKSAETAAAARLAKTAALVKRQHLGKLQHNKTIVVDGKKVQACVCGSTNHSWRGFFVQNNNAIILRGPQAVKIFMDAYDHYEANDTVAGFGRTGSAVWNDLKLQGIKAQVGFSPRSKQNAVLAAIAKDIEGTTSSLFFSLAFLYQTPGPIRDAVKKVQKDGTVFSYGISDHAVDGLSKDGEPKGSKRLGVKLQKPDGKVTLVHPQELTKNAPQPFKGEPTGGGGTRMHHKFIVIDFDKPTARVYMGSYNFSSAADVSNGENLLMIRDRRVAVSYVVEAVRIFDHYHFRVAQADAKKAKKKLQLAKPPRKAGERAWWAEDYTNPRKILDRELFA